MTRWLLFTLLLTTASCVLAAQSTDQWVPPTEPVYVVAPNFSSEGSGPEDTKFGDLLMVQIYPSSPPSAADQREPVERERLYQKGALLPFFVDGERRREVRIAAIKKHQWELVATGGGAGC